MNEFRLTNGAAVVTGSASGIGQATAWAIDDAGATVGLIDLLTADFSETQRGLAERGATSVIAPADVSDLDSVSAAIVRIGAALGPVRYVVNAAGIARSSPAEDMSVEEWRLVYEVDLAGLYISALRSRLNGRIAGCE